MEYPFFVYRTPGPHPARDGGKSYDFRQVENSEALALALADGWHETYEQASGIKVEVPIDESAPTRAELEQQATELGLKFDGRTSDRKLLTMIDQALV